jgi:hypothetical protein
VRLRLAANKMRADSAGTEKERPTADDVTAGVFGAKTAPDDLLGAPLRCVAGSATTIDVVVDTQVERKAP